MRDFDIDEEMAPFDWAAQHKRDRHHGTITINVGRDELGLPVKSLRHVTREVDYLLQSGGLHSRESTKLYIIGDWAISFDPLEPFDEPRDSWAVVDKLEDGVTVTDTRTSTREEREWKEGIAKICEVIKNMEKLKEVTWISSLAFTKEALDALPVGLEKLVINVSHPVALDSDDFDSPIYIKPEEMRSLTRLTELSELRILDMRDSFQSIIWEAVYKNKSTIRVLDLQMAAPPVIHYQAWVKAEDVCGLLVVDDVERNSIKGAESMGHLHHRYGTGEYLDQFCMMKSCSASGRKKATPLPIQCLKLDGFVIDHEPFKHELINLVLLSCGENCVDAGFYASEIPANWRAHTIGRSLTVDQRFAIVWPNWTCVFDRTGRLIEKKDAFNVWATAVNELLDQV